MRGDTQPGAMYSQPNSARSPKELRIMRRTNPTCRTLSAKGQTQGIGNTPHGGVRKEGGTSTRGTAGCGTGGGTRGSAIRHWVMREGGGGG